MNRRKILLANNPLLAGPSFKEREKSAPVTPYREVSISDLSPDPDQPRRDFDSEKLQELADSIELYGIMNPITVRLDTNTGSYIIISGERRYRAAQLVGLGYVPIIIKNSNSDNDVDILAMQLVENLQRDDLKPIDRAHAIAAFRDSYSLSLREIEAKLSISKSLVQRSLDLLKLPDDLQAALRDGASESKILLLAKIEDPDLRAVYLKDLDLLSREELKRDLLQKDFQPKSKKTQKSDFSSDPQDDRICEELQQALGLKVRLVRTSSNSDRGKLFIEFYSDEDLQEVFRRLMPQEA
jgi:ParB family transcriptional regulator, chromosome partitioning protein